MFEDIDEAIASDAAARRRLCGFGQWVLTLSQHDADQAKYLVADTSYNCRQLARYFQSKGARFNDQVLNRHRNGTCCGQKGQR